MPNSNFETVIKRVFKREFGSIDIGTAQVENMKDDRGGPTLLGVASRWWPREFEQLRSVTGPARVLMLMRFYRDRFWDVMHLDLIDDLEVADDLMDFAVNAGTGAAHEQVRDLQHWLNQTYPSLRLTEDGLLGPATASAIAKHAKVCDQLLDEDAIEYYKAIVVKHPEQAKFLASWFGRRVLK